MPPHVCLDCYWESRVKALMGVNKQLRGELLRVTGAAKKPGRKPMERERDDGTRDETPDVIDEMTNHGRIRLDE